MKKEIKIAGAGIAGLTCAINLAKAGYKVIVLEKSKQVGKRHHSDFQGIGNWFTKKDILQVIQSMSIKPFPNWPVYEFSLWSPSLKRNYLKENRPFFYLVKRGGEDSLDENLAKQAQTLGVEIKFNTKAKDGCQVIATGPKKASAYAIGITFDTSAPNQCHAILNDEIAPKGYAYLLINNNQGTLACVCIKKTKDNQIYIKKATEQFKKVIDFDIKNPRLFVGYGQFFIPYSAKKGNRLHVGEAAGFQDYLFGFGMTYAIFSGYLAARSIIENKDYNQLWKDALLDELKASIYNRFLFEMSGNKGYRAMLKLLSRYKQPLDAMYKRYHLSFCKRVLYPLATYALSRIKKRELIRNPW